MTLVQPSSTSSGERERKRERETDRQTDRERRQTDRQTDRQRQTDKQTDRETDRETDRQTDRQTDREVEFCCVLNLNPAWWWSVVTRGAIHRQNGEFVKAVDELLTAVDKCGGKREREKTGSTYSTACRQLVCTYNDFAIQCFK